MLWSKCPCRVRGIAWGKSYISHDQWHGLLEPVTTSHYDSLRLTTALSPPWHSFRQWSAASCCEQSPCDSRRQDNWTIEPKPSQTRKISNKNQHMTLCLVSSSPFNQYGILNQFSSCSGPHLAWLFAIPLSLNAKRTETCRRCFEDLQVLRGLQSPVSTCSHRRIRHILWIFNLCISFCRKYTSIDLG